MEVSRVEEIALELIIDTVVNVSYCRQLSEGRYSPAAGSQQPSPFAIPITPMFSATYRIL